MSVSSPHLAALSVNSLSVSPQNEDSFAKLAALGYHGWFKLEFESVHPP